MFKKLARLASGQFTPEERYILGEKLFLRRKIESINPNKTAALEVDNLFLKKEIKRLNVENILLH